MDDLDVLRGQFEHLADEAELEDSPDVAQAAAWEEDVRVERLREMNDEG